MEIGSKFYINKVVVTVLKVENGRALVQYPSGDKGVYKLHGNERMVKGY